MGGFGSYGPLADAVRNAAANSVAVSSFLSASHAGSGHSFAVDARSARWSLRPARHPAELRRLAAGLAEAFPAASMQAVAGADGGLSVAVPLASLAMDWGRPALPPKMGTDRPTVDG